MQKKIVILISVILSICILIFEFQIIIKHRNANTIIKENGITLSKKEIVLTEGENIKLNVEISPSNSTYRDVTWHSSDETVVKVANGVIFAVGKGEAVVSVISHFGEKDIVLVTVNEKKEVINVTGINIIEDNITLIVGESSNLQMELLPSNATNKNHYWTSSDSNIVSVNNEGYIKANNVGEAIISVKSDDGSYTDNCNIIVKNKIVNVTSISLDNNTYNLSKGDSLTLKANILPSNATNQEVIWKSSDLSIATVSNGIVKTIKDGEVYIYAMSSENNDIKASCLIKVISSPVTTKANLRSGYKFLAEYNSDTLKFWVERGRFNGYSVYVSHIWVKDAYNQLRTALTPQFGTLATGETIFNNEISKLGLANKGAIAINASGFVSDDYSPELYRGKNGIKEWKHTSVSPIVIYDGKVIRNFTNRIMPSSIFSVSGLMKSGYINQYDFSNGSNITYNTNVANKIISDGVKYTWGFVGFLIKNKTINVGYDSTEKKETRSAIGQIDRNNFILISGGKFTLYELAKELKDNYGCQYAINLDGGGSSSMYYKTNNSKKITRIRYSERALADILYFAE